MNQWSVAVMSPASDAGGLQERRGFSGTDKPASAERGDRTESSAWNSRGYLPHFDSPHAIQHVTFHLADSLPADILAKLEEEVRHLSSEKRPAVGRNRIEEFLDAGHGSCILREPEAARVVQDALLHFEGERYHLFDWSVMPNHVHSLLRPMEGWPLRRIVASWKSFTGRRLSPFFSEKAAPGSGFRVWQREYWDRYIRDERHFTAVRAYIRENPVKAGLARRPEDWPWSSAGFVRQGNAAQEPNGPG